VRDRCSFWGVSCVTGKAVRVILHELARYWNWAGSNIGAMPACGAVAVLFAVCFRKPAAAWWRKHFGQAADLADIKAMASAAHTIAADLFEHHTGKPHALAPTEPK
jgi:hypothetical protein